MFVGRYTETTKDYLNMENINFVSYIFVYFPFMFSFYVIFTCGVYIHLNFDAINCSMSVVTQKKQQQ